MKNSCDSRQGSFITNGNTYSARSGMPFISETTKWGKIPEGNYNISSTSNTGGIKRYNLDPQQNIGNRSNLQIHQKS